MSLSQVPWFLSACLSISICVHASLFLCLSDPLSCLDAIKSGWNFAALNISAVVMMKKWSQAVFICQSNGENLSAWSLERGWPCAERRPMAWNCHKFDPHKTLHPDRMSLSKNPSPHFSPKPHMSCSFWTLSLWMELGQSSKCIRLKKNCALCHLASVNWCWGHEMLHTFYINSLHFCGILIFKIFQKVW